MGKRNNNDQKGSVAIWCVHDDHWFLQASILSFTSQCKCIVFVSKYAWDGSVGDWERCKQVAEGAGAEVVLGEWKDESTHRRAALNEVKSRGYRFACIPDGDEVISPELLEAVARIGREDLADMVRVRMDTYWSDTEHVVRPREELAPIILIDLHKVVHSHIREYEGQRVLVLGAEYGVLHHLSYVGPDERVHRKLRTWSHRSEVSDEWLLRSWEGWKKDPLLRNLHPTHDWCYGFVERIKAPEILSKVTKPARTRPHQGRGWPRLSVVIPLHGGADLLRLCLESVAKCEDLLFEVIVVDDASPDDAATVASDFNFARLLSRSENGGFAVACNDGISAAAGEIVLFLNSDTVVARAGLIRLIEALSESGSIGAAGPLTNRAAGYQQVEPTYTSLENLELFAEDLADSEREDQDVDLLIGFALAVKKSVLDEVGGFDERFGKGMFEDNDLCYRIARAGYRLRLANRAYIHHWGSATLQMAVPDLDGLFSQNSSAFEKKWSDEVAYGFASHLPGFGRNGPVSFNPGRHPQRIAKAIKSLAARAQVTLCMIVRNEERVLNQCLESAKPFFTEIIVVDTGSTDRTVEIAKSHGAKVIEIEWPDSFAAARNESLRHATTPWIFWMDADDTLPAWAGELLLHAAINAAPEVVGFIVPVQFVEGAQRDGTRVDHVKLFRNVPGLHFVGRIHEQVLQSLYPHGVVVESGAVVMHSGYDNTPEGQARKRVRDEKLLKLDLDDRPGHPFALFNLGMTAHFNRNHEAAVEWLTQSIENSDPGESHVRKAYALKAESLHQMGDVAAAIATFTAGLEAVGPDPELYFQRAKCFSEIGSHEQAIADYEAMPLDTKGWFSSLDRGILGYRRLHNMATELLCFGRYGQAKALLKQAIDLAPWHLASSVILFDAAMENGDLTEAAAAARALEYATSRGLEWAERQERLEEAIGGPLAAEKFLIDAANAHKKNPAIGLVLARRLCRTGREREALPMLMGLQAAGVAEAAYYLGLTNAHGGSFEEALSWTRRARDLNPLSPDPQPLIEKLEAALPRKRLDGAENVVGPHVGKLGPASCEMSIVIVTFNSSASLMDCLGSIEATVPPDAEVIIVDNNSADETFALATEWGASSRLEVQVERLSKNVGYSKAANLGLLKSKGKVLILLNPDTVVYPGWTERLEAGLEQGYAAVGPLSDNVGGDQFVGFQSQIPRQDSLGGLVTSVSAAPLRFFPTRLLFGFCLALKRETLNLLGLLDEDTFLGADDLELSWRLRIHGFRLGVAANAFIHHVGQVSFSTVSEQDRHVSISRSDKALFDKLSDFYRGNVPSSAQLFGSGIFQPAIDQLASSSVADKSDQPKQTKPRKKKTESS